MTCKWGPTSLAAGPESWGHIPSLQASSLGLFSAELCRPMLVCRLQGPKGLRGQECFLRVTAAHLFEVELQAARTLERLELQCLESAELESEMPAQEEPGPQVRMEWPVGTCQPLDALLLRSLGVLGAQEWCWCVCVGEGMLEPI